MCLVFDVETGPLADDVLAEMFTFEPPPHPGEFDPASVSYGNLKDESKRAAKLKEKQDEHITAVERYPTTLAEARKAAWSEFVGKAALDASTGQVLAIGMGRDGKSAIIAEPTEAESLAKFWKKYQQCRKEQTRMVGANIFGFDLPFMIRRSWVLSVDIPTSVCQFGKWGNYDPIFVDIREWWQLGQRNNCESSLDHMARTLGVGAKTEGIGGADFARLWFGSPEEKQQAVGYLLNDLKLTANVASRLGVI